MATTQTTPARRTRPKQAPPTLVLFVRHGTTPTTGKVLPGRAPGLHLADAGRAQAQKVAERLAAWAEDTPPAGARPDGTRSDGTPPDGTRSDGTRSDGTRSEGTRSEGTRSDGTPPDGTRSEGTRSDGAGSNGTGPSGGTPEPGPRGRGFRGRGAVRAPTGIRPTAVYASPLERTRETAAPIAAALNLRVKVNRGLLECDFGDWTGAELKALSKLPEWTTVQRFPSGFRFPNGESFTGMQARMVEATAALVAEHPGQAVVAVSHADPIKAVVAAALGTHLDLFQRIVVSPCSVTAISYGAGGPTVLAVNSTGSLTELRPS
jgi:probable phosphomutase (TIGR03848 family)